MASWTGTASGCGADRLHGCCGSGTTTAFQSMLLAGTVTSNLEGWWGWQRWGVDLGQGAQQCWNWQGRRGRGRRTASHDKAQSSGGKEEKRWSRLAFGFEGTAVEEEADDYNAAIKNSEQECYLSEPSGGCHRQRSEPVERRYEIGLTQKDHTGMTRRPGHAKEDCGSCTVMLIRLQDYM